MLVSHVAFQLGPVGNKELHGFSGGCDVSFKDAVADKLSQLAV